MKNLQLEENELNELCAKLANELEDYGSSASSELKQVFLKAINLKPTRNTTLMNKFVKKLFVSYEVAQKICKDNNIKSEIEYKKFVLDNPNLNIPLNPDLIY